MGNSVFTRLWNLLFNKHESLEAVKEELIPEKPIRKTCNSSEIDEEDRLVVALAATIMAGKHKPNSHFHISNIRKIDSNFETVPNEINEIEEEDRLVVALAASIMAGKDNPNSHFHISKITRIHNSNPTNSHSRINYEIDEEDRLVVALATSIIAGKHKPNSHFHICKITRIS
ncbi:hypothetical protein J2Z44_000389 [Clostridium punense]|uniref:Uncharacterized protein n=1 Tax=Clostridium punense TaxID=1054297 RepID=A0ABS4JYJ1_9CLOT|nr:MULTISPECIES: hypothetical protein [Clostridium]EQB87950.1 hypothetical protein M918_06480 [Clostridium sp. BL8]MBP2020605.1 hypothetical protein [Clostridium punense]